MNHVSAIRKITILFFQTKDACNAMNAPEIKKGAKMNVMLFTDISQQKEMMYAVKHAILVAMNAAELAPMNVHLLETYPRNTNAGMTIYLSKFQGKQSVIASVIRNI